ncbi:hypothetical protein NIES208_05370 [[Limnothrix rosea] IAM M-220]|nr:hypothetical protein NIES208_05370 [[Limnothrix rosea] IAM M-220]
MREGFSTGYKTTSKAQVRLPKLKIVLSFLGEGGRQVGRGFDKLRNKQKSSSPPFKGGFRGIYVSAQTKNIILSFLGKVFPTKNSFGQITKPPKKLKSPFQR